MTSGAVAAICFGFLLAAAVPIFAAISNARDGLLSTFFPTCFAALPKCSKNQNPSATIFLSDTIKLSFLLHVTQVPRNKFRGYPVFLFRVLSPRILLVAE